MISEARVLADTLNQRADANSPLGIAEMRAFAVMLLRIVVELERQTRALDELAENALLDERARRAGGLRTTGDGIVSLSPAMAIIEGGKR